MGYNKKMRDFITKKRISSFLGLFFLAFVLLAPIQSLFAATEYCQAAWTGTDPNNYFSCYTTLSACQNTSCSNGVPFSCHCVPYDRSTNTTPGNTTLTNTQTSNTTQTQSSAKGYALLAPIPTITSGEVPSLAVYMKALIVVIVGLAIVLAVVMILVGGIGYVLAASPSAMSTGKGYITNALIGLFLAIFSYLLLYTINPDLTVVGLNIEKLDVSGWSGGGGSSGGGGGGSGGSGNGSCSPVPSCPSSVDNLTPVFGDNATKASGICNGESSGNATIASRSDVCADGNSVSYGLFQINISANPIGGFDCPKAFTSAYTGSNHSCRVKDQALFNQCVATAKNPGMNIAKAASMSHGGSSWRPWGANKKCGF